MKPDLSGGKGGSLVKLTINESEVVLMLTESVIRRLEALGTKFQAQTKGEPDTFKEVSPVRGKGDG